MRKKLNQLLWKLRLSIFKAVFGMNPIVLMRMQSQVSMTMVEIRAIKEELEEIKELALDTVDMTGGPGWVQVIQNAVMQLDKRLDSFRDVIIQHQQNFEVLAEQEQQLIDLTTSGKKELN